MEKPYLYNTGLKKLAKEVIGNEKIHLGIRPFGFHAGNLTSLYIYPYLFCEEVAKLNKPVNFTFYLSINDYEQDELAGPDYKEYPFNIYPKKTILKFSEATCSCHQFTTDHWLPIISGVIKKIKNYFPEIKIIIIKNSLLKDDYRFKKILLKTIKQPGKQISIYKKFSGKKILSNPIKFASAVCPKCNAAIGETYFSKNMITHKCFICDLRSRNKYKHFDYWFYHKPLFTARMNIFEIDISFSGSDHYNEGDFYIRKKLMSYLSPTTKTPKMFFAPIILTKEEKRMSKTQKNTEFGAPKELLKYCRNLSSDKIILNDNLILKNIKNHENYLNFF